MKKRIWFIVLISCLLCGCIRKDRTSDSQLMDSRDVDSTEENENAKEDVAEQWEKGYDLPIDEPERKEAEDECKMIFILRQIKGRQLIRFWMIRQSIKCRIG